MATTNGTTTGSNTASTTTLKPVYKNNKLVGYKCQYCGKTISIPQYNAGVTCGTTCGKLRAKGFTTTTLQQAAQGKTVTQLPANYFKTAMLHKVYQNLHLPINRFVTAMGGDRGLGNILPGYQYVTYGKARYLPVYAFTVSGIYAATNAKITAQQLSAALTTVFGKAIANQIITAGKTATATNPTGLTNTQQTTAQTNN